jgi:hypothetical protein
MFDFIAVAPYYQQGIYFYPIRRDAEADSARLYLLIVNQPSDQQAASMSADLSVYPIRTLSEITESALLFSC